MAYGDVLPVRQPTLAEIHARIDQAEAEATAAAAEAAAAEAAVRKSYEDAELAELTAKLRRQYLEIPGATETQFTAALPRLLEDVRQAAALAPVAPARSPIARRDILRVAGLAN